MTDKEKLARLKEILSQDFLNLKSLITEKGLTVPYVIVSSEHITEVKQLLGMSDWLEELVEIYLRADNPEWYDEYGKATSLGDSAVVIGVEAVKEGALRGIKAVLAKLKEKASWQSPISNTYSVPFRYLDVEE